MPSTPATVALQPSFHEDVKRALTILRTDPKSARLRPHDLRWVLEYVRPHLRHLAVAAGCMGVVAVLGTTLPIASKFVIDSIVPARDLRALALMTAALAATQFLKPGLSFVATYRLTIVSQGVTTTIREDLFRHVLRLPLQFFDTSYTGYLMARLAEVNSLGSLFSSALITPLVSLLDLVASAVLMLYLDWRLTCAVAPLLAVVVFLGRVQGRGIRAGSRSVMEQGAVVARHMQESISGVHTIKEHGTEDRESKTIAVNLQRLRGLAVVQSVATALAHESVTTVTALGGVVLLWLGGVEMIRERLTLGEYLAFTVCAAKVLAPAQVLATLAFALQPACAGLRRLGELRDAAEDDDENRTRRLPSGLGPIACRDVHFQYREAGVAALDGLTLRIEPGESVAIVGASGSGKSTLLRLLLGLAAPTRGSITIAGVDIADVKRSDLRERIAIVSQRTFLFNDTISHNIRYSRPDATWDEVVECARMADAHEFITALPQGYATVVGERGCALSGGQIQRLSIARALLKGPDILILDEATSNLDPASERRIWDRVDRMFAGRTRVLVTHRPATIARADRVIFVDRGRVVATGTNAELLRGNERYRAMLEADVRRGPTSSGCGT